MRAFVLAAMRARALMVCPGDYRVCDGEAWTVGYSWSNLQFGIDAGRMMERLAAQVGRRRFHRFLLWVDGENFGSFDTVEQMQLESDALKLKQMALEAYARMFPYG